MIEDFDTRLDQEPFDPFSVVLFKALQAVVFLFFITLLIVSPHTLEGKVDSKAEFLITMSWPDNHPDDIDLFVMDPLNNVVWYRRKEAGLMVLERDDRGGANDFMMVDGRKMLSALRQEIVTIRGVVAGEYTVNIYHFTATTGQPVPVTVTVQKLNPAVKTIAREQITMHEGGAEKTAVRFTVDKGGAVLDVSHEEKSILQSFFTTRPQNGGLGGVL